MACVITHDNKKYTQPEFNEYFKSHFFEFASDFLGSKQDIQGFKDFVQGKQSITPRKGISKLFSENPQLASIGTPQQYSQYLDTIFPDSKVKDIVYHFGEVGKNEKFNNNFAQIDSGINKKGFQFATSIKTLLQYGISGLNKYLKNGSYDIEQMRSDDKLQAVLLNTTNPFIDKNLGGELTENNDAYARLDYNNNGKYIVFEPEQIHILSSKQDIEGFEEFVEQPINKEIKAKIEYKDWANKVIGRFSLYTNEVLKKDQIENLNHTVDLLIQDFLKVATFAKEDLKNRQYLPFINKLKQNGFKQVENKEWLFTKNGVSPETLYKEYIQKVNNNDISPEEGTSEVPTKC